MDMEPTGTPPSRARGTSAAEVTGPASEAFLQLQEELLEELAACSDLQEGLEQLVANLTDGLGYELGILWQADGSGVGLRCSVLWSSPALEALEPDEGLERLFSEVRIRLGEGLEGEVWRRGRALSCQGTDLEPLQPVSAATSLGLVKGLAFPLRYGTHYPGVLALLARGRSAPMNVSLRQVSLFGSTLALHLQHHAAKCTEAACEARRLAILRASPDAIMLLDHLGRLIDFSPAAERMFGLSRTEVLGQEAVGLLLPRAQRERQAETLSSHLALQELLPQGRRLELTAQRANGEEFPAEIAISRVEVDGPPLYAGHIRDISERQITERSLQFMARAGMELAASLDYRATLSTVADLVVPFMADLCVIDMLQEDGSLDRVAIVHRDPQVAARLKALQDRRVSSKVSRGGPERVVATGVPEFRPELDDRMTRAMARSEAHLELITEMNLRSYLCVPMMARGRALGSMTLITTDRRRLTASDLSQAQELAAHAVLSIENARLYREARQAARMREEFLAVASHELRTPLTSLQLNLQGSLRAINRAGEAGLPPERILGVLETCFRQVDRLSRLVNSLLDLSRVSSGRLELQLEALNLTDVVREACARVQLDLEEAECPLELALQDPVEGRWDRSRVEQVVTNLLSNAMKYGPERPITVVLENSEEGACLKVTDRGIGIPVEMQSRIFDRFERAVSERHYSGFGLGLWIVREIVSAMGGRISVQSKPGEGSTFRVDLPRERVPA